MDEHIDQNPLMASYVKVEREKRFCFWGKGKCYREYNFFQFLFNLFILYESIVLKNVENFKNRIEALILTHRDFYSFLFTQCFVFLFVLF